MHLKQDSINIKGTLLDLSRPMVLGILNTTEDSFYDGGKYVQKQTALHQAKNMLQLGADIIDIGGASSRPGAEPVPPQQEQDRVLPVISAIVKQLPNAIISIDTNNAETARLAIQSGAHIVNDISAGDDDERMLETVGGLQVPYIAMHKQGTPKTMQDNPKYNNVVVEVTQYFLKKIETCRAHGIKDIIIDPGFGFGKTVEHNYALLKHLSALKLLTQLPILVGVSRKSMINKVLNTKPADALNGTSVLHAWALQNGANIIRVHDVKEAVEAVKLYDAYYNA